MRSRSSWATQRVAALGGAGERLAPDQLETAAQQLDLVATRAGGARAQEQRAHGVPVADDAVAEREPALGVLAQVGVAVHVVAEPVARPLDRGGADVGGHAARPQHAGEHVGVHALGVQGEVDDQLGELVAARLVGGGHAGDGDRAEHADAAGRGRPGGVVDLAQRRGDAHLAAVVGTVGLTRRLEEGGDALDLLRGRSGWRSR